MVGSISDGAPRSRHLSLVGATVVAYAAVTIYLPKVAIGNITFYLTEPLFLICVITSLATSRFHVIGAIDRSYYFYCAVTFLTAFEGFFYTNEIDISAFVHVVKYTAFIAMLSFATEYGDVLSDDFVRRLFTIQLVYVGLSGLYVAANVAISHPSASMLIWTYSNKFRLVGLTGYVLRGSHLQLLGSTSVAFGVYVAFLSLLYLSLFLGTGRRKYLLWTALLSLAELLTFSRSGLVTLFIGIVLVMFDYRRRRTLWRWIVPCIVLVGVIFLYGGGSILRLVFSFGSLQRLSGSGGALLDASTFGRLNVWSDGWTYIAAHPFALFLGTGYGDQYSIDLIGRPHLESLIFTTLFQSGIIATAALLVHFFVLWRWSGKRARLPGSTLGTQILYAMKVFVPGMFIANVIGGNTLQTDFFAPLFYFLLGIGLYRTGTQRAP